MRLTTTDLYESSFLHCSGTPLAELWLDHGKLRNQVVFAFDGNYKLEELRKSYFSGQAVVNLASYRRSLNYLRERMFQLIDGRPASLDSNLNPEPKHKPRNAYHERPPTQKQQPVASAVH